MRRIVILALIFLGLQGVYWWHTVSYKPYMEIVPSVPSEVAVKAISFGDSQFFFRVLGIQIQNFGDTFGRFTPLYQYDMGKMENWFRLLDTLDNTSDYIPTMASFYFSQTQNTKDVIHMVNYLRDHSEGRLDTKWWWRAQAVYLANHKLEDPDLALELALPLVKTKNVPPWVNQLAAFIYEKKGEFEDALAIMQEVEKNADNLTPGELRFIEYFVKERLGALEKKMDGKQPAGQ
jgi:hypothetical protein